MFLAARSVVSVHPLPVDVKARSFPLARAAGTSPYTFVATVKVCVRSVSTAAFRFTDRMLEAAHELLEVEMRKSGVDVAVVSKYCGRVSS